jgi:hypothetical protein
MRLAARLPPGTLRFMECLLCGMGSRAGSRPS